MCCHYVTTRGMSKNASLLQCMCEKVSKGVRVGGGGVDCETFVKQI